MMKHIRILGAAAAALAASAVPVSAQQFGQRPPVQSEELEGAPRLFAGQDRDDDRERGDRDWDRDRGRRPDFQYAQRNCSREANREAWDRNYYSAQYDSAPRLDYTRDGWELRGRMRLHDRRGYSYVNTVCDIRRNGDVSDFDFLR
ncbi:MAG TPA: hypothetical protein VIA80_17445 [Hyphomonadaceae bacterium]|jgi:hypothetical protein